MMATKKTKKRTIAQVYAGELACNVTTHAAHARADMAMGNLHMVASALFSELTHTVIRDNSIELHESVTAAMRAVSDLRKKLDRHYAARGLLIDWLVGQSQLGHADDPADSEEIARVLADGLKGGE